MSLLTNFAKKVFGTQNERELKSIYPIVARINERLQGKQRIEVSPVVP